MSAEKTDCYLRDQPAEATATVTEEIAKNHTPGWVKASASPDVFAAKITIATSTTSTMDHFPRAAAHPGIWRREKAASKAARSFSKGKMIEKAVTRTESATSPSSHKPLMMARRDGVSEKKYSVSSRMSGRDIPSPKETLATSSKNGRMAGMAGLTFQISANTMTVENGNREHPADRGLQDLGRSIVPDGGWSADHGPAFGQVIELVFNGAGSAIPLLKSLCLLQRLFGFRQGSFGIDPLFLQVTH